MRSMAWAATMLVCVSFGCKERAQNARTGVGIAPAGDGSGAAPAAAPTAGAAAQTSPALGSMDNPVKCDMPGGQRAYLQRLKCADGTRPTFHRVGSFGKGPHGNILDGYDVKCGAGEPVRVYMDMYHAGFVEKDAVPVFTIDAP